MIFLRNWIYPNQLGVCAAFFPPPSPPLMGRAGWNMWVHGLVRLWMFQFTIQDLHGISRARNQSCFEYVSWNRLQVVYSPFLFCYFEIFPILPVLWHFTFGLVFCHGCYGNQCSCSFCKATACNIFIYLTIFNCSYLTSISCKILQYFWKSTHYRFY